MKKKTKKEREEFLKKQFFAFELFEKMAQDNLRIHKKANSRLKNTNNDSIISNRKPAYLNQTKFNRFKHIPTIKIHFSLYLFTAQLKK